jgi:hypothetical protein
MYIGLIYYTPYVEQGATPDKLLSAPHNTWAQTPQTLGGTFTATLCNMMQVSEPVGPLSLTVKATTAPDH